MSSGYDPHKDQTTLGEERVSLLRILLYGGITYHVLPTVREEFSFINDEAWRREHEDITIVLCLDHWEFDLSKIEPRKQYFFNYHGEAKDCQILAEAEAAGMDVLLSCDKFLQTTWEACQKGEDNEANRFLVFVKNPTRCNPDMASKPF
jgi:hypothetical protein